MEHRGLNQLLCAAVVSTEFSDRLVHHTEQAIMDGYLDFSFQLTKSEEEFIKSVNVKTLDEFAEKIYAWINKQSDERDLFPESILCDQYHDIEIPCHAVIQDNSLLYSL